MTSFLVEKYIPFLKKNGFYIYVDSVSMNPVFRAAEFEFAGLFEKWEIWIY